ncbi:GrpB family protein [Edaphobacter dinghuensis]|uniref:GrpB protein n=1 Tax=Edaphobacter dinghuensis TaxID=1560005 RepID=A0A917LYG5_9BACT|nr:GrpB family protein [Edaphobacter dinghuensis]GGG67109.1 hypothetical protein GCM10011585_06250 [Edaphobacter dinghuensis]
MYNHEHARQALGHVSIAPPDPCWPIYFSQERDLLRPLLGSIADELQHYGSTAVAGLSAKPIIDMMAPVASLTQADAFDAPLDNAGYRRIDAGFFKRRFFRKTVANSDLAYHLHLVVAPDWPIKNELLLRDWLIQHPEVARAYEALKLELASACGDDMPRYTDGKTSFLHKAVNDARRSQNLPIEHDWAE